MFDVFTIETKMGDGGEPDRQIFTRIGKAIENRDGSLNVLVSCVPLDGKLHVRPRMGSNQKSKLLKACETAYKMLADDNCSGMDRENFVQELFALLQEVQGNGGDVENSVRKNCKSKCNLYF